MRKICLALFCFISCLISINSLAASVKPNGMVVSEQRLASAIGASILQKGGNAIDAAVAVGYALAVVNPCCGNIGGGGFMTVHFANGKNIFLNFREKAPLKATPNMFLDAKGKIIPEKSTVGYLAVGVPGTVLGLDTALQKYGTMSRKEVMAPAIQLAEKGYALTSYQVKLIQESLNDFRKQPNVAAIFLKNNQPYQVGDIFKQTDLANTLKLISNQGSSVFYNGSIAERIVKASQTHGGILSMQDFVQYHVEELAPVECRYHEYTIISAPPPSSGGTTLCETLNILEGYPLSDLGYHSAKSTHFIVEALHYAFYDRNNKLGDPQFIHNPVAELISKKYAAEIRKKIQPSRATPTSGAVSVPEEKLDTTHYSVIDQNGNAVSVTYTLNGYFGAKVIAGNTGFFLNDEMDDFTSKPGAPNQFGLVQGNANEIQPGKRPLSSMTPTIIFKNGKLFMVLGSPGGPRIITSTLQTFLNVVDYGMTIQKAVDASRFHYQWQPDVIDTEPFTFSKQTITALQKMGHHIKEYSQRWSAVEAILVDLKQNKLLGGSDNRRADGAAVSTANLNKKSHD